MARAIWSGAISFGLVNVPVKVFTAVREHSAHFHQLEKGTGARIRYEKVSERSGKEVAPKDIELGYELARGQLVTVDPEQLSGLRPRTTRTIDVSDFVDLSQIDPVFYDRTYWLAPDGEAAHRPYGLLVEAMQGRNRAGIGTVVMRNKQYLAAIRAREGALAMSTMHFADEIVSRSSVEDMPSGKAKPGANELKLASQIVDALSTDWDPGRYRDSYTGQVRDLIERQAAGKNIVVEESPAEDAEVLDLVAALEASLQTAKSKKRSGVPSSRPAKGAGKASSRRRPASAATKSSRRRTA
ncbi:MAG TPA: Ku protein [Acidimicrobiales bacterium]|nr:Ku protein [Acidimicrobiales bacterium]